MFLYDLQQIQITSYSNSKLLNVHLFVHIPVNNNLNKINQWMTDFKLIVKTKSFFQMKWSRASTISHYKSIKLYTQKNRSISILSVRLIHYPYSDGLLGFPAFLHGCRVVTSAKAISQPLKPASHQPPSHRIQTVSAMATIPSVRLVTWQVHS